MNILSKTIKVMWDFTEDKPIYLQLTEQMCLRIANGTYRPGDKFPSVRDIATEAGVNPNTVQRAFAELERSGIVCAQRTAGRFITEDSQMIYKLREDLAKEHADNYLKKMASLGYNRNEATDFLSKVKEEL